MKEFCTANLTMINFSRWLEAWTKVSKVLTRSNPLLVISHFSFNNTLNLRLFPYLILPTGGPKTARVDRSSEQGITNNSKLSSLFAGTQDKCVSCNKKVYPLEKVHKLLKTRASKAILLNAFYDLHL